MKVFQSKQFNEIREELFHLGEPKKIKHGVYISNIEYDNNILLIQLPEMISHNGIINNGKHKIIQLEISPTHSRKDTTHSQLCDLIHHIENIVKKKILENAPDWFDNEMNLEDIEYFFSGLYEKDNFKTNIPTNSLANSLHIMDENELLRSEEDIKSKPCIGIVQIKGLRFTSTSFKLETTLRQIMILEKGNLFSKSLVKRDSESEIKDELKSTESDISDTLYNLEDNDCDSEDNETNSVYTIESRNTEAGEEDISEVDIEININTAPTPESSEENVDDKENDDDKENKDTHNIHGTQDMKNNDESNILGLNSSQEVLTSDEQENETNNSLILNHTENNKMIDTIQVNTQNIDEDSTNINTPNTLEEFELDLSPNDSDNPIQLKKKDEVYYEIYKEVRRKAKMAKKAAMIAYLEAKHIKNTYMLNIDDDSSDEEDLDNLSEFSYDELEQNL